MRLHLGGVLANVVRPLRLSDQLNVALSFPKQKEASMIRNHISVLVSRAIILILVLGCIVKRLQVMMFFKRVLILTTFS